MSRFGNRFIPAVESLEVRETPSGVSGRITGIVVDPDPGAEIPPGSVRFIVDGTQVDAANDGRKFKMLTAPVILEVDSDAARYFNGFVSRFPAGGSNETIAIGGARTETAHPTILLQRLANP